MRKILTVKELITILLDYNMDAYVYVNANGLPTGISLPNVCFGSGKEGETRKGANEVIFDIQEEERYNYKKALSMELTKEIQIGGFVGCVACKYQDECNSNQFGQGCEKGLRLY